jgi:hypothetical protein
MLKYSDRFENHMLGEQFAELNGRVTGQRIVNSRPLTMETTANTRGRIRDVQVTDMVTFVVSETTSSGVLHGTGTGVIRAIGRSDIATYTGEGIGTQLSSGAVSYRGSVFLSTTSTGALSFLNNMIGVFEIEIDHEGNFKCKTWQWK